LRGGETTVVDGIWAQVRKVRRRRITEALIDPSGNPFEPRKEAASSTASST